jgi:hypothetical protein
MQGVFYGKGVGPSSKAAFIDKESNGTNANCFIGK